ncbi:MAG: hypothetical protein ACOC7U_03060 [Spirochaetota bacterium]
MKNSDNTENQKVFLEKPSAILEEARSLLLLTHPHLQIGLVEEAFYDTLRLFRGEYPGYRECRTRYHDVNHTCAVFLAAVRLMHGAEAAKSSINIRELLTGVICALFHDAGLIQREDEEGEGTGAKYTIGHEERSINFTRAYLSKKGFNGDAMDDCAHIIGATITGLSVKEVPFRNAETELVGKILGTADLLAQLADRIYLEKLLYLYREFQEAGISGFNSEFDLLKKTESFYRTVAKKRMNEDLGGVWKLMKVHFRERYGVDRDFYQENIQKNITYLGSQVLKYQDSYRQMLRRAGIVESLEKEEQGKTSG